MSKGEIISHIGDGKYKVRQKLAVEKIQQELVFLNARIAELAINLPEAKLAKLQKEAEIKQVQSYLDQWIDLYKTDQEAARSGLLDNQKVLVRLSGELRQIDHYVSSLIAENLAALKRRAQLEAVPEDREVTIWCADYSLELEGEVGLADINDEGGQGVIVRPGFDDLAVYSPTRDGSLFPILAQTSAQAYLNAALLPGVQKWRPKYRIGTITGIEEDTCDLTLDPAESSAQGLDINKETKLSGVPIKYMDCNGAVFEVDDRVIVEMQGRDWEQAQVIGFEKEPRECGIAFLCDTARSYCSSSYNGVPFISRFYKINFSTYEIQLHSEIEIPDNTLIPESGYYVHEREPYRGLAANPACEFSYGGFAEFGLLSGTDGFLTFSSPNRGIVSPAKISDTDGVGISPDLYLPGDSPDRRTTTLVFFDIETLNQTGEYSYQAFAPDFLFERVVANNDAIVVQTFRGNSNDYYGLMSFDRNMNLMAQYVYGLQYIVGVSGIASNSKYVFVAISGQKSSLFVHDAQTLSVVHEMDIPDAVQAVAATESHVILCSLKSENRASEDGRTEIYKIANDPNSGFGLTLKKTAYWFVGDGKSLFPIA